MNYHDFIWDLGGTLIITKLINAFVATLKDFHIQADHDSVYAALKISTQDAIKPAPHISNFLSIQEKEALGLQEPTLFEGAKELLRRDSKAYETSLWYHIDRQVLTLLDHQTGIALLCVRLHSRRGLSSETRPSLLCFI